MSHIDDWADVLSTQVRRTWPKVAEAVTDIDCALMDGTGVAMILRHRTSEDLDIVTFDEFDAEAVGARLIQSADIAAYRADIREHMAEVSLDGVQIQVFRDLRRVTRKGKMGTIAEGMTVDGLKVGSVPDLAAMKMDVIQHRSKVRDYLDITELDRTGVCRIEDGLQYHAQRYGVSVSWTETCQIADLVTQPPQLDPDPAFASLVPDMRARLGDRRSEVIDWALRSRERATHPAGVARRGEGQERCQ